MNRYKIDYTTGNGQWNHRVDISARTTGDNAARTLIHQLLMKGVEAVVTKVTKV